MGKLISADELVSAIQEMWRNTPGLENGDYYVGKRIALDEVMGIITRMKTSPAAPSEQVWISVNDRIPEEGTAESGKEYLVASTKWGYVDLVGYNAKTGMWVSEGYVNGELSEEVTHWMVAPGLPATDL